MMEEGVRTVKEDLFLSDRPLLLEIQLLFNKAVTHRFAHSLTGNVMFSCLVYFSGACGSIWTFFTVYILFIRNLFVMVAYVKMNGIGGGF